MKNKLLLPLLALVMALCWAQGLSAQQVMLSEDFQSTSGTLLPAGWDNSEHDCTSATPTNNIWKSNSGGYYPAGTSATGQRCAYLYAYNNNVHRAVLKSPSVKLPAGRDAFLRFRYKNAAAGGSLDIYLSTDSGRTYLMNPVDTALSPGSTWTEYEYRVEGFTGQTISFVFVGHSSGSTSSTYYYYLDDITIETAPTCQPPAGLTVSQVTQTSARLAWGLKGAAYGFVPDTFHIELSDAAGTTVLPETRIYGSQSYAFTGLAAGTTYRARVRSNCTANYQGMTDWTETNFVTQYAPLALPYREGFDSIAALPEGAYGLNATINTTASYVHSGSRSLKLTATATISPYIILPPLDVEADNMEIDFYLRRSSSTAVVKYQVGYVTDPYDLTTFVPVLRDSLTVGTAWQNVRLNTASAADRTRPIMPCIVVENGASVSVYVDDIDIHTIPSCIRAEQVTVSGITAHTATVAWTTANASQLLITALNTADSTILSFTATQSPHTITGLAPQTDYRITVRGICSAADSSQVSLPVSIRTLCDVAPVTVFSENFNSLASNSVPECWSMGWLYKGRSNSNYPFTATSTQKHGSSGKSMSLVDQFAGTLSYLSTQAINFDSAGRYDVSLWVYRQQAAEYPNEGLRIWVTPAADDTAGGICLGTIHRHYQSSPVESGLNQWYQYQFNIPVSGTHYIMIEGVSEYGNATYFDDFEIMVAPTCRKVTNVHLGQVATTTADIAWTPTGAESQWVVEYTLSSAAGTVSDTVVTTAPRLDLTGLSPATPYTLSGTVRALCSTTDTAEGVPFSIAMTTECVAITELPYRQGFEDSEAGVTGTRPFAACWTRINDASSSSYNYYPYNYTTGPHTGAKSLYHNQNYAGNYADNPAAVLPAIDVTVHPVNTLRITYWAAVAYAGSTYSDGTIIVGVMSDPADISTFVDIDTVVISGTGTAKLYSRYTTEFGGYTGAGSYIAFRFPKPSSKYNYVLIDDVVVDLIPACAEVKYGALSADNVTENSMTIIMADTASQADWTLAYGITGTPVDAMDTIRFAGDSVYTFTGLASSTEYQFYARRNCSATEVSPWSEPIAMATTSVPAEMPYVCGFEDPNENRQWQFADAVSTNATKNNFAIGYADQAVHTGLEALYVSPNGGESYTYEATSAASKSFAYRTLRFDSKVYSVAFSYRATGGEANYDFGRAMVVPASTPLEGGVGFYIANASFYWPVNADFLDPEEVANDNPKRLNCMPNAATNGWGRVETMLDMRGRAGVYNLAFMWNNDASGNTCGAEPLAIDDISIEELTCTNPTAVTITALTSTAVTLAYPQTGAAGWEVIVDDQPINTDSLPATPLHRAVDQTGTLSLTGLAPNTQYYYTLRTICSAGDTAGWRSVESFRTFCSAIALPYEESFDGTGTECWSAIAGSTGNVSRNNVYHHAGSASMRVVATSAVSPEFIVDSLTHYQLSGFAYATTDSVRVTVGLMTDPADASSYESFGEVLLVRANSWQPFTVYFTDLSDDDYADFRSARHIVLVAGDNTVYFDDLILELTPSCPQPTEAVIDSVTAGSFRISFRNNSAATDFVVRLNGNRLVPVHSNPATITGLAANTDYSVEIAAICSAADTSRFTDAGSVRTACSLAPLPWICGFEPEEGYVGVAAYAAGTLDRGCWTVLNAKPNGAVYPYCYTTTSTTYVNEGSQGLYIYNYYTATKTLYAIFPEFKQPLNQLTISAMIKVSGTTASVGYITDPADESTYVQALALPSGTSWHEVSAATNQLPTLPANARLAIALGVPSAGSAYVAVDNIVINRISSCSAPESINTLDVSYDRASFTVADSIAGRSGYEYVYGERGVDPDELTPQAMTSVADTISLAGLTADTYYELFVRAHCGTDTGLWGKVAFHTGCAPHYVTEQTPFYDSFEEVENNTRIGGCYAVVGAGSTYFPKGFINTYYPAANPPYWNRFAHTNEICLNMAASKTYNPAGLAITHSFRFDAGRVYKAQVYARALSSASTGKLMLGSSADVAEMRTLARLTIAPTAAQVINAHGDEIKCNDHSYAYRPITGYFTVEQSGVYYIAVVDTFSGVLNAAGLYIDDFSVEEVTGCTPTPVTVDSVTGTSIAASLSIFSAGQTYEYCLLRAGSLDTVRTWTAVNAASFVINGLAPSTQYRIVCRQACADGQTSAETTTDVATACEPIVIAGSQIFYDSFEGGLGHNSIFDGLCYEKDGETASYPIKIYGDAKQTSHFAHDGLSCLYMYHYKSSVPNGLTLSRQFHLTAGHTYDVIVYGRATSVVSNLKMNYGLVKSNMTLFGDFALENCGATGTNFDACWRRCKASFTVPETGDYYISLTSECAGTASYAYTYLDDLTVREQPTCAEPEEAPTVNSTTRTTASLTIDMAGKQEAQIIWSRNNAVAGSVITTEANNTISGLDSAAVYTAQYRYICSAGDTSFWSPVATFRTKASDCFAPENVRLVADVNDHHAEITWGRVPDATAYSYTLTAGNDTVALGTTASDTIVFDTLTMNTSYILTVEGNCGVTAAGQVLFRTTTVPQAVPFVCDFEDLNQNRYWDIRNVTNGTNRLVIGIDAAAVAGGQRALYETNDGSTYTYGTGATGAVAEVILTMQAGRHNISYDWKCKGELNYDYGRVFLMPAAQEVPSTLLTSSALRAALPAGAISASDVKLNQQEQWQHANEIVNIPRDGYYRFVVAITGDASGAYPPAFTIDNIAVVPISCDAPVSANVLSTTDSSAVFTVQRNSVEEAVYYGLARANEIDSVAGWTVITDSVLTSTINIAGLTPGTIYWLYVRNVCDSDLVSQPLICRFTTRATPHDLPYVCGFETTDDVTGWLTTQGTADNYWIIGNGTASTGRRSLHVTPDGASYGYNGAFGTITRYTWSYAYIPLRFEQAAYEIEYDWVANGEGQADYVRLFLLPTTYSIPENVAITGLSATALPVGAISLDGGKLNLSEDWQHNTIGFNAPTADVYNLVALWRNDGTMEHQPAGALDNINVHLASCPTFATGNGRMVYSSTDSTIDLRVRGNLPTSAIGYHFSTSSLYTDTVALGQTALGDSMIHVSGLTAGTRYYARIWGVCDGGLTTTDPVSVYMRTACGVTTVYPWAQDFEAYNTGVTYKTELSDNCWFTHSTATTAYHYINTGTSAYSGTKGLYIYNGSSSQTQTFGLPYMSNLEGKHLSFAYRQGAANYAQLELGYLTQDSAPAFIRLYTLPETIVYTEFETDIPQTGLPQGGRLAFRTVGTNTVYVDNIRINDRVTAPVVNDTICSGNGYYDHGLNLHPGSLLDGDTTLSYIRMSQTPGVADSIMTVNIHVLTEIVNEVYDNVCAGLPYNNGLWNIANPQSTAYTNRFTSHNGCDSLVVLYLTVLPTERTVVDTVCQGDIYQIGDTAFAHTGVYVFNNVNASGCNEQVTLRLTEIDSVVVTTASICGGTGYQFEGRTYNQSGVYRVPRTIHGCTQMSELHLTVMPADSTINVTICQGGQALVVDTVITTAGQFDLHRVTAEDCYITYHINSTVTPPVVGRYNDDACEGIPYNGFGVSGAIITCDTLFSTTSMTANYCDSITEVTVKYHPTQYSDTTATMGEDGSFEWHDNTYTVAGDYTETLRDQYGCDSVVTLHLLPVGVDDVLLGRMRIAPNPARKGQTAVVFTESISQVERVEVVNSYGAVVDSFVPHSTPLSVTAPEAAGIYHIRIITAQGAVYVEKLIVQ